MNYAVAAVEQKEAVNRVLAIGGDPVTWRDVVDTFSEVLGPEIPVQTMPPGEPVPGLPDFVAELLASLELYESPGVPPCLGMGAKSRPYDPRLQVRHTAAKRAAPRVAG